MLRAAVHGRRARGCERSAASRAPNQASGAPRSGACCGRAGGHRASRAVGIASSYIKRSPERLWPALVPVGVHAPTLLSWKRSELRASTVLKTSFLGMRGFRASTDKILPDTARPEQTTGQAGPGWVKCYRSLRTDGVSNAYSCMRLGPVAPTTHLLPRLSWQLARSRRDVQ